MTLAVWLSPLVLVATAGRHEAQGPLAPTRTTQLSRRCLQARRGLFLQPRAARYLHCPGWRTSETFMGQDENPLERAWLHVIKCEAQLTAQVLHIRRMACLSKSVTEEEAVLADLEKELRLLRGNLALEQAAAARRCRRHSFASFSTGEAKGSA